MPLRPVCHVTWGMGTACYLLLRLIPVLVWVRVLVLLAHNCLPPPVFVSEPLVLAALDQFPEPVVLEPEFLVPPVLITEFSTPVCARIHVPPARSSRRSAHHCPFPTQVPKKPLNLRRLLPKSAISIQRRADW